jgi:ubiquinone biosynthesis protein UbiJ
MSGVAARALQAALNGYLALDVEPAPGLEALRAYWVGLAVEGAPRFCITAGEGGLEVRTPEEAPQPDAWVHASALALAQLGLAGDRGKAARDLRVEGDAEAAAALQRVLTGIEIDWEEVLSRVVGDVAARQVGNLARDVGAWGRRAGEGLGADLGEYLTEEARVLASRNEIEQFLADVDRLRDDVERLEARVKRLEAKAGT